MKKQENEKKEVALVFGISSNFVFALANTLIGLTKHNEKFWDDIIVYCDDIDDNSKEKLNEITECKFVVNQELDFLKNVSPETLRKYSPACFYRFECFNLLKEYKTVIWNDVDILIQGDISGLLNYGEISGFALTMTTANFKNEANFTKLILDYDMFCPLYNSGILVLKDTLKDYDKMYSWCAEATSKYASILRWPDQGIINLLIQEFSIIPELIDIEKYCCHPSIENKIRIASIIHAYGDAKFWNSTELEKKFPEWKENEKKWEELKNISETYLKEYPLVSCVMSTYNRYDYLKESVQSILNQTYKNFELIVVLEKCENQDIIENILKKFRDDRIIIIKNTERLRFPKSLNVAINKAKGKYIARMDDDDVSLPERFEKQVEYMENHPEIGICGTNAKFIGLYNTEIGVETDPELLKIITLFRTPLIHPTVMMNRQMILDNNLSYDPNYFTEDYELWSRAVACFPITNLKEILLNYRTGSDNLTNGSNEEKMHSSHKKIMSNQFKNYLNIKLNNNELELIQQRFNVLDKCFNLDETLAIKYKVYQNILNQNEKLNVYNQDLLKTVLDINFVAYNPKQSFLKRLAKKIGKPIYSRLMNRVDAKITEHDNVIYQYINKQNKKLEREIYEEKK